MERLVVGPQPRVFRGRMDMKIGNCNLWQVMQNNIGG